MAKKDVFSELIKLENVLVSDTNSKTAPQIIIYPELKAYIPPLTKEEFLLLEQNIVTEGCREALILWQKNDEFVLIDGHNRYEICQKHQISYKTMVKNFAAMEDVKMWMLNNQLGKRNITEEVKSYLRGLQYKSEKKHYGGKRKASGQHDYLKTHEKLATEHQVSAKTIQRDELFFEGLELLTKEDKALKWKILQQEIKLPKALIISLPKQETSFIENLLAELHKGDFKVSKTVQTTHSENRSREKQQQKEINSLLRLFLKNKDRTTLLALQDKIEALEKWIEW